MRYALTEADQLAVAWEKHLVRLAVRRGGTGGEVRLRASNERLVYAAPRSWAASVARSRSSAPTASTCTWCTTAWIVPRRALGDRAEAFADDAARWHREGRASAGAAAMARNAPTGPPVERDADPNPFLAPVDQERRCPTATRP